MASDNTCKYLAETYPAAFASWLLTNEPGNIQVLKTELNLEPIRADSLTLLQTSSQILHLEFQTLPYSTPSLPFRMLDYWVRLKRQYPDVEIVQIVIFLKPTDSELAWVERFQDINIEHRYQVIRMWEQESTPLLANPALLPLATLAKTDAPITLLQQVAVQVARIEEPNRQAELSACVQMLAGLKFEKKVIQSLFKGEVMRESVIYQEILAEGIQQGMQQGMQQEAVSIVLRLLTRRIGEIAPQIQAQIVSLSISQVEELSEALLDFSQPNDLIVWLTQHS